MYEVRWTTILGNDYCDSFDEERRAWRRFEEVKKSSRECDDLDSVGIYFVDGDGNEKELGVWSR